MITRRPLSSVLSVNLMGGSFDGGCCAKTSPVAATRIARIGFKETSLSLLQYIQKLAIWSKWDRPSLYVACQLLWPVNPSPDAPLAAPTAPPAVSPPAPYGPPCGPPTGSRSPRAPLRPPRPSHPAWEFPVPP